MKSEMQAKICQRYHRLRCAIDRPVIKKQTDSCIGIYSGVDKNKPIYKMSIDGEWCLKLSFAVKVVGAILAVLWIICRICRMMDK